MDPKLVSSIRDEVRVALAPLIRTPQIGLMSGATFATLIENAILASHEAWALGADTSGTDTPVPLDPPEGFMED